MQIDTNTLVINIFDESITDLITISMFKINKNNISVNNEYLNIFISFPVYDIILIRSN